MKYKMIDLFAGCGGLEDGFLQSGKYQDVAAVEWLKPQVNTLINRLKTKWDVEDAAERVMHFDIQREEENRTRDMKQGIERPYEGKGGVTARCSC